MELVVCKTPNDDIYTLSDKEKCIDILLSTNTLKRNNDPHETHPKSSRSAVGESVVTHLEYQQVCTSTYRFIARTSFACELIAYQRSQEDSIYHLT
jgi:hypothetical protein